jgi:hypothetical protein
MAVAVEIQLRVLVLLGVVLLATPALAQTPAAPDAEQASAVGAVQKAVLRALNFSQGDLEHLKATRADFTPEGWKAFMKHLDGFLDDKGAPIFTSSFVQSGGSTIISQGDGVLHLTLTGTLKQTQKTMSATYPIVVEVRAVGKPMKIEHLKQSICGGRTATPCQ